SRLFILKLGIPLRTASLWGQIQHQPERIDVRSTTRILARVRHRCAHFSTVEVSNDSLAKREDAEAGNVGVLRIYVGPSVLAVDIRKEREVREAALLPVFDQALDGGTGSDSRGDPLSQVDGSPVPGVEERCAHGTRRFPLRTVHHAVDQQSALVAEQLG